MVDAEASGIERGAVHGEDTSLDHAIGQHTAGDHSFGRKIGEQRTESDRHEEEGFEFFVHAEVEENGAHAPHDGHLPGHRGKCGELEERGEVAEDVDEQVHRTWCEA